MITSILLWVNSEESVVFLLGDAICEGMGFVIIVNSANKGSQASVRVTTVGCIGRSYRHSLPDFLLLWGVLGCGFSCVSCLSQSRFSFNL
jgi:hypothetical protein